MTAKYVFRPSEIYEDSWSVFEGFSTLNEFGEPFCVLAGVTYEEAKRFVDTHNRPDAKHKVDDRVHHDDLCLTITDVAFSDLMNEYSYAVRKTDGGLMPFFMRLLESELKPCDCKPTTKAAAMPVARTSVAYKSNEPDFQIGDYVRVKGNGARGTIQSLDRGDAILDTGKRFWTGELILLQRAALECDVCGEIKTDVETEHMDADGSFSICADCRAERNAINAELPGNSEQLPYTPDYDGWLQLVVDTADPSKPSIHFVRDWDRAYYVFASECDIVYEALKPFIAANPVKPVDPIPFAIDDDDNTVLRMVFQDWSPRKVPTFNDAMIALRNAGYRVVLADGEKVMKYDPSPKQSEAARPSPQLHDGDEVFYGSACYKIAGEGIWKADSYWYHIASHCGTAFVPESKIKLFAPNPTNWIGHYALMKVSHHQEGNAKSWQEKVVVIEMKAGFVTVRRGTTHTRLHFRNLTLLDELASEEEMAAPAPTWDLPRIIRTDWTEVR